MTIGSLNMLPSGDAITLFRQVCDALRWAEEMVRRRPFLDSQHLAKTADEVWNSLDADDWKEAFSHHPMIGDVSDLHARFPRSAKLSQAEQAGLSRADDGILRDLAAGNRMYKAKFGFIFIVCATGKSAPETLSILRNRLGNDASEELEIAAAEQSKITRIRLEHLFEAQ